jgi:hypothetical protein
VDVEVREVRADRVGVSDGLVAVLTVAVAGRRKNRLRRRLTPPEGGHGPVYQIT